MKGLTMSVYEYALCLALFSRFTFTRIQQQVVALFPFYYHLRPRESE